MKKFYFLLLGLFLFSGANAQIINIPDWSFKAKLLEADQTNNIASGIRIDMNYDNEIQVNEAALVQYLNIDSSFISDLTGIEYFVNVLDLSCNNNSLTTLDVTSLTNLHELYCYSNQLATLNASGLVNLTQLGLGGNQLTVLNVSGLTNLQDLNCGNNQLGTLNVSGLANLKYLSCYQNQLTTIDLTGLINLERFGCAQNQLSNLNLTGLINLQILDFPYNQLSSVNVSNLSNLMTLDCTFNQLSSLNVSGLTNLSYVDCDSNQLTSLDLNGLVNLENLSCQYNQLQTLNLNTLTNLQYLNCSGNQLININVGALNNLQSLNCYQNSLLTTLFIKNGSDEADLNIHSNPNLQYICADESQITQVQDVITLNGYSNCQVNSYCSFTPGGTFYTIQGNNKYDGNSNGCDALDLALPNLKYNLTDGTNSGSLISNTTGSFAIPVLGGTHTITPTLENPTYFTISPTTVNVTFPQASPFTQNFCITANGVHPDLEVTLLPLIAARPGFDAKYKIIYKNKGNTTQSGSVNLAFNDAVLDLVVSNPVVTNQTTNNLSWNFTNLFPFETREIELTLNVNSPTETPAVNSGYILNYNATITSAATDDTPNDNAFAYNQTVVNSFDPNDKTCLEGATITPAKVGDYVHYMIRFENTGTFPAENIVVKDMIDLAKFDISTLVPIKGSHSFVTNITSGNKVEFIFEGINLPFDNANNDGYVAFKIKTKPTLVVGNTFTNNASIYFDYNFPIVTNTATTTIAVLATQDFVFSNYFTLHPNPVKDILNITAKEAIEVTSINIYNTLGQLVLVIPNAQHTSSVDVSGLTKGNYFIKINSDKGTSNTKFIKN